MKTKTKKAIALALCAVMLIAGTALTTVAYLTDSESVNNTFTVGKIGITLDEALVNEYGQPINNEDDQNVVVLENAPRVAENDYKLIPGMPYTKDPTVTVAADSEECYVRMIVTISEREALDTIFAANNIDIDEVFDISEDWKYVKNTADEGDDYRIYEFRYNTAVSTVDAEAEKLAPLFTKITMPWSITEKQIATLEGLTINIEAHAIQAKGFTADEENGKSAEDVAWEAFDYQKANNN